jgi:hypothetical protein
MKIIDFEKKGNVVKFYLGDYECNDYWGDDWNDTPYEHNAGIVSNEFVKGTATVYFPFEYDVAEPSDDWHYNGNSPFCKEDFKNKKAPCIVANKDTDYWGASEYSIMALSGKAIKFFYEDYMEPGEYYFGPDGLQEFEK